MEEGEGKWSVLSGLQWAAFRARAKAGDQQNEDIPVHSQTLLLYLSITSPLFEFPFCFKFHTQNINTFQILNYRCVIISFNF